MGGKYVIYLYIVYHLLIIIYSLRIHIHNDFVIKIIRSCLLHLV